MKNPKIKQSLITDVREKLKKFGADRELRSLVRMTGEDLKYLAFLLDGLQLRSEAP